MWKSGIENGVGRCQRVGFRIRPEWLSSAGRQITFTNKPATMVGTSEQIRSNAEWMK
jgi:hypothetical protein